MNPLRDSRIVILYTIILVDIIGIGMAAPVLPDLVKYYATSRSQQIYLYGFLNAAYGLAQFICVPILGRLSDQYGRRPILVLSTFGLAFDLVLTGLSQSVIHLFLARLIGGMTSANYAVANAYLADVTKGEQRNRAFGNLGAVFGLGFVLGPVLGGWLACVNIRLPFYFAAVAIFINGLLCYCILPETNLAEWQAPRRRTGSTMFLSDSRNLDLFLALYFLHALAQFTLQAGWPIYTSYRFTWKPIVIGWSLMLVGCVMIFVQTLVLPFLTKRLGEMASLRLGLFSALVGFSLYAATHTGWLFFVIIILNGMTFVVMPTIQALISKKTSNSEQGAAMGRIGAATSFILGVSPLLAAFLMGSGVDSSGPTLNGAGLFLFCAFVQSIACILFWVLESR